MRCILCDHSPDTQSDYNSGLILGRKPKKLFYIDQDHERMVCDVCQDAMYEEPEDLIDPNEEMRDEDAVFSKG